MRFKSTWALVVMMILSEAAGASSQLVPIPIDDDLTIYIPVTSPANNGGQSGTETYGYDALGRLTQVYLSSGAVITYTYDQAGNRKTTITSSSRATVPAPPNCQANPALCS